ncbi:MAG: DUF4292 domain-containing protein [Saprospiraceae bacterium]|nr:DUF4292 domain-containing protein [Saprospiraceae bacterium]
MNNTQLLTRILAVCLLASTAFACKTTKVVKEKEKLEKDSDYLLNQLLEKELDFEWFSAKARISYQDDAQGITVSSTIRMKKDSLVWLNVKKLGFEIARVLITPDSVHVMDRFNKEYYVEGIDYVEKMYNIPSDLGTIQNMLMGKAIVLTKENLKTRLDTDAYFISGQNQQLENQFWLGSTDLLLQRTLLKDKNAARTIRLDYQEYGELDDARKFSYLRKLNMDSQETGRVDVEINFSNVEINVPKQIRFEVPSRYTRLD